MSASHPTNDDRFDRLVDDELSEPERSRLLESLDQQPDGWRRCALAFLEAQCWREGLGDLFRRPKPPAPQETIPSSPTQKSGRSPAGRRWSLQSVAAMAMGLVACFLLAVGATHYWHDGGTAGPSGGITATDMVKSGPQTAPLVPGPSAYPDRSTPWQMVGLPTGGDNGTMVIPAKQRDRWDDRWMQNLPSAMPENVRQALERTGHRVLQQREVIPVQMDDGRVLFVPVEQMEIQSTQQTVY
jgi:hypothetical protein